MNAAMSASEAQAFRQRILERRSRLEAASESISPDYLSGLLEEIDAALDRISGGTFGICETCHDSIEKDRLQANPLVRFCLDHLSRTEAQAHEQDMALATEIQSRLLPPPTLSVAGWESHYRYQSAGPVGGDYCEVMALDDHSTLFFAVGDVAGKGVAASLLMTHLSAIFRSLLSMGLPLSDMMARANRLFCEGTDASHYATLVCGCASGDVIEFCNAGHCRPLLVNAKGVEPFDSTGLPLGLFCGAEYPSSHARLAAGDSLVLYTDGVTEARHGADDEFGEAALIRCLERHAVRPAESLAREVLLDVDRFRAGTRPHDDVTLLVLRRSSMV